MATEGLLATWATGLWTSHCWDGWLYGGSELGEIRSESPTVVESGYLRTDHAVSTFRELTIPESKFVSSGLQLRQRVQQERLAHHGDPVEGVQVQVLGPLFPQQGSCFNS